jgi:hypothetical protein
MAPDTATEPTEDFLTRHGDTLFQFALLLGGDEQRAATLLLAAVRQLTRASADLNEAKALCALRDVAHAAATKKTRARRPLRLPADLPPVYRSILNLPIEQRFVLALHLLLGYDLARIAALVGEDMSQQRAMLEQAVRSLAPATSQSLTDITTSEECVPTRAALIDPSTRARRENALRLHLSSCSACRSFEFSWDEITRQVEQALRSTLRERTLPTELAKRLVVATRPKARRDLRPLLRVLVVPLAVLVLLAALILPGIGGRQATVVDNSGATTPAVDPRQLVEQALATVDTAPAGGSGVWHAQWETMWYLGPETFAPIRAEAWIDPRNPQRHRVQITHSDGGAPYEFQLSNARDRLYYAVEPRYSASIYGDLDAIGVRDRDEPSLQTLAVDSEQLTEALAVRLNTGVWSIDNFYLQQAAEAEDLRTLGRQRDSERLVQIVSFNGVSPLGFPADAPGATAQRVTVLLAIDSENGRLRSATELAGPPGGTQVSRQTWRLVEENWISAAQQIDKAFSLRSSWNGIGDFNERRADEPALLTLPLLPARQTVYPIAPLFINMEPGLEPLVPSSVPPGVEHAAFYNPRPLQNGGWGTLVSALIYGGPGRALMFDFVEKERLQSDDQLNVGEWSVALSPGRGQRYTVSVRAATAADNERVVPGVRIEAVGYRRAELLAIIEGLRPLDVDFFLEQEALFAALTGIAPALREQLVTILRAETPPPGDDVYVERSAIYWRHKPASATLDDPYSRLPYGGLPEEQRYENWLCRSVDGATQSLSIISDTQGTTYGQKYYGEGNWYYAPTTERLFRDYWSTSLLETYQQRAVWGAVLLLNDSTRVIEASVGGRDGQRVLTVIAEPVEPYQSHSQIDGDVEPYLFDIDPARLRYEFTLDAENRIELLEIYGEQTAARGIRATVVSSNGVTQTTELPTGLERNAGDAVLLHRYEVLERATLPLAEAPQALRDGEPPQARFVEDYRNNSTVDLGVRDATIEEAAAQVQPLFVFPEGTIFTRTMVQVARSPDNGGTVALDGLDNLVARGLAVRQSYVVDFPARPKPVFVQIDIVQGATEDLTLYLRGREQWEQDYTSSERRRLVVAGAERDAWLMNGLRYVFVEIDGTLLIVENPYRPLDQPMLDVLAQLEPYSVP